MKRHYFRAIAIFTILPMFLGMTEFKVPDKETLRQTLTPLQWKVTQEEGTERPFTENYHDNKEDGIYASIVTGQPLFDSRDKFDSGTGWPSFTRPIREGVVGEKVDRKLFMKRIEVHEAISSAHLGHVFKDGPAPTGLRYCLNGAALKFIPRAEVPEEWGLEGPETK